MNKINVIKTDMTLEKNIYNSNEPNLRSPRYTFNLFNKLGNKRCALCDCEIPELIQGAHILPVASIKKMLAIPLDTRLEYALDGENGLWLCENHHKLFDEGIISFDNDGNLIIHNELEPRHTEFINEITKHKVLPREILTDRFLWYLEERRLVV